jgi:hypothetical protein
VTDEQADKIIALLTEIRDAPGSKQAPASANGGAVFPNYGRSKGAPISGASEQDLDYYANGCRRTLSDDAKRRFWDREKVLLAAIEAEQARRGFSGPMGSQAPKQTAADFLPDTDADVPFGG